MAYGRLKAGVLGLSAMFAVAAATEAHAARALVTYIGTVESGQDLTQFFGTPTTNLAGAAYSLRFTIDTDIPGAESFENVNILSYSGASRSEQAAAFEAPFDHNPVRFTEVTINGVTRSWGPGDFYGSGSFSHSMSAGLGAGERVGHGSSNETLVGNLFTQNAAGSLILGYVASIVEVRDLTAPLFYSARPEDTVDGLFEFKSEEFDSGFSTGMLNVRGVFAPSSITVSPLAPVPEPGEWAMMVVGLGVISFAARKRARA